MITGRFARAAASIALPTLLAMLALLAADSAWALTITPPPPCVIELKSPLTKWADASCGTASSDPGATVDSDISNTDTPPKGVTLVKWTASLSGETASAWQAVVVADTARPTMESPAAIHTEATGTTTPPPAAFGNAGSIKTAGYTRVTCDSVKPLSMGVTRTLCTAKDSSDNSVASTWAAVVQDTTPPTIPSLEKVNVEATEAMSLPRDLTFVKPTATDLVTLSPDVSYAFLPSRLPLGDSTITWTATDEAGNTATAPQTIKLVDTTPPTIIAPTGVSVYFRYDFGPTPSVFDSVDPSPSLKQGPGSSRSSVTWVATDDHDNSSTLTQTRTTVSEPAFTMTKLRTLDGPWGLAFNSEITRIAKDVLMYVGTTRNSHGGLATILHNTTNGSTLAIPRNAAWIAETDITPIGKNATDTRFATSCPRPASAPNVCIFDITKATALKTLTPPQLADGRAARYGATASSGSLLFIETHTTAPAPNLKKLWTGSIHAYNTTTWKLEYEIENPTPSYGDRFGDSLWTSRATPESNSVLYVWSRSGWPSYSADHGQIQTFDTSNGRLLRSMAGPQHPHLLQASYSDGILASPKPTYNNIVASYRNNGSTGTIQTACCFTYFGHGLADDGDYLYTSAWPTRYWTMHMHAYNTTTNALARTYYLTAELGNGLAGALIDIEHLEGNKFAAVEFSARYERGNTHILEINPKTPAVLGTSAQAAPAHDVVNPLLLYAEPAGDNSVRLVYNTTLNPHTVDAQDYEIDEDGYGILAADVTDDHVLLTYAAENPKPAFVPTVYQIGDIAYLRYMDAPAPAPAPAPIDFTAEGLDGAKIKLGTSQAFDVVVTRVEGGGAAIILLTDQPNFVSVQNTGVNRATITINASHASVVAESYTFNILAATGSNPVTKPVTVSIIP